VPVYRSPIPVDHNINQVVQKNYPWGRILSQINELRIFIVWTPWRFAVFCADDVGSVRNIKCACSVRGLIRLISWLLFMVLIGGVLRALFLSLVVFFSSVPVTTRWLDLFSGAYLNKLSVCVVPRDWQCLYERGLPGSKLLCLMVEAEPASETCSVKFWRWDIVQNKDIGSVVHYLQSPVVLSYFFSPVCLSFQVIGFFEVFLPGAGTHYLWYNLYCMSCLSHTSLFKYVNDITRRAHTVRILVMLVCKS
jgi:hypothetical protein